MGSCVFLSKCILIRFLGFLELEDSCSANDYTCLSRITIEGRNTCSDDHQFQCHVTFINLGIALRLSTSGAVFRDSCIYLACPESEQDKEITKNAKISSISSSRDSWSSINTNSLTKWKVYCLKLSKNSPKGRFIFWMFPLKVLTPRYLYKLTSQSDLLSFTVILLIPS